MFVSPPHIYRGAVSFSIHGNLWQPKWPTPVLSQNKVTQSLRGWWEPQGKVDVQAHAKLRGRYNQNSISRTPYPPIGWDQRCHRSPKSSPSSLIPPKKASTPKLKCEALEISEVGGPFERKVLIRYSCYWGPLWKRGEPTDTLHLLLRASLKT